MADHPPVRTFKPRRRSLSAARTALFERLGPQFLLDETGPPLVLADVFARTVMSPAELPIGVVTAFFGAPFFALVLRTTRRTA